ncbi:MAG: ferredoxin reductase [Actinophytocola sp.]|nr:ferredoxin reductase [Actinophytocola sp.]
MSQHSSRRVVIVGASLGGLRTAEALRAAGFEEPITLVGEEPGLPYDRPPLSKQVLAGAWSPDDVTLCGKADLDALDVDQRLGCRATAVEEGRVILGSGESVPFSDLVIATGVAARRLPDQPDGERIHVLRTLDDSIRLRDHLRRSRSLVVVGGGFIGAEVAAVARGQGLDVTMVEVLPTPFARALGTEVGQRCAQLHLDHDTRIIVNALVTKFEESDGGARVTLGDGRVLEADCVLVGVGTSPNTRWLSGLGVDFSDGVPCDEGGRVDGRENVFAVGDVAAWHSPTYGHRHRVEHWTSAGEQARTVAHNLAGKPPRRNAVQAPYFWSDQYGTKLQLVGRPDLAERVRILEVPDKPGSVVGTFWRSSRIVAAVTFGAPVVLARYRPLVTAMASEEDVRATESRLALWPVR